MNHTHLFLQGEDKLYLGADDSLTNTTNNISTSGNNSSGTSTAPSGTDNTTNGSSNTHNGVSVDLPTMGSRHWQVVPIPQTYLAYNWPIRVSLCIIIYYSNYYYVFIAFSILL